MQVNMAEMVARLKLLRSMVDGLSVAEASELAGLSRGALGHIEGKRRANPSIETVGALAQLYGASLDWMSSGEGAAPERDWVRVHVQMARERAKADG